MPYQLNNNLPPSVRNHLPEHAQDIYREAFNHAYEAHAGELKPGKACPYDRVGCGKAVLRQGSGKWMPR